MVLMFPISITLISTIYGESISIFLLGFKQLENQLCVNPMNIIMKFSFHL